MSSDATAEAPQRGRPRSERARKAILEAAAELLLARGLSAVSMDAVAERAGVSKATIYRWWPTKETLALDALYAEWAATGLQSRDTGSLRGDLLSLLRPWARLAGSRPYGRVVAALLTEAQTDPVFATEYRQRFVEPRRSRAGRSSAGPSSGARFPQAPRSRWRWICCTGPCTTACCTATRRSATGSSATSWTWSSTGSARAAAMLVDTGFPGADAENDFLRARRREVAGRVAYWLRRERGRRQLLPLEQVVSPLGRRGARRLGLQTIPLDTIVGTLDARRDFDRRFRPRPTGYGPAGCIWTWCSGVARPCRPSRCTAWVGAISWRTATTASRSPGPPGRR